MRDPLEATPGHKEVRSEEGKGGGGAGPWRVSPARTATAVRGQIGLVTGLVSKSSATRTRLSIREGAWETWQGVQRCRAALRGRGSPAYLFRAQMRTTDYDIWCKRKRGPCLCSPRGCGGRSCGVGGSAAKVSSGGRSESGKELVDRSVRAFSGLLDPTSSSNAELRTQRRGQRGRSDTDDQQLLRRRDSPATASSRNPSAGVAQPRS